MTILAPALGRETADTAKIAIGTMKRRRAAPGPALNRAIAPDEFALGTAELPISPAFLDLFHSIEAARAPGAPMIVQFTGTDQHAQTAQMVSGLARTASRVLPTPILYVDATGGGIWAGPDMLRAFRDGLSPSEIALPTREARIRWAATGRMLALAGEDARRLTMAIRDCFALTLIDCGAMGSGTSTIPLARYCDVTVLVTEADKTRASAVGLARTAIERAGGTLLGAVLNGGGSTLPRWLAAKL
jgi:hypothetical protein